MRGEEGHYTPLSQAQCVKITQKNVSQDAMLDFITFFDYNLRRLTHCPHSSVGQSSRLIIDWSQVQVLLGAPKNLS